MMCEPPIDELVSKAGGNKYRLSCVIAKRAKELEKRIPEALIESEKKSISMAADEIINGFVVIE